MLEGHLNLTVELIQYLITREEDFLGEYRARKLDYNPTERVYNAS